MNKIIKNCILFIFVMALFLVFSSCAVGEDSSNEEEQPYRRLGSIKYDEKLGQAYQIVDYNIVDIPGDNSVIIELFFVTNYSLLTRGYELSCPSGGEIANDADRKSVPYLGDMYYSTLLGDGIVSAVGVHIIDAIFTEDFKKKLETDKNHKGILEDDIYRIFRITEVLNEENGINQLYIYGGTAIYELTTDLRCGIEENKFVIKLNYKRW